MRLHLFIACLLVVCPRPALAQEWVVPLTEYGFPDLQGNWSNAFMTPLQRPLALGERRAYSESEVAEFVRRAEQEAADMARVLDPDRPPPERGGTIDQTADGNFETVATQIAFVGGEWRTSLIVEPADGRLPIRDDYRDLYSEWRDRGLMPAAGPEARGVLDRCLSGPAPLPLLTLFYGVVSGNPGGDNPVRNVQIVQTADYVLILGEYFSQVRIIPLASEFKQDLGPRWMGDSIASYVGNSLVIQSRNFRAEHSTVFMRSSTGFEVTETYTRTSADEILLRYTVVDPVIYSEAVTAEIPLQRMAPGQYLYEYGCHEGNYSMVSILRGARMEEIGYFR